MTVRIELPAEPALVGVARLIATSMARQATVDETVVEEIRLAVGEACARAVAVQIPNAPSEPILVSIDDADRFVVEVTDAGGPGAVPVGADHDDLFGVDLAEGLGLALLRGLVDDLTVEETTTGTRVRLAWPLPAG